MTDWTIEDSTELYGIEGWGAGHFRIGKSGEVEICIDDSEVSPRVSLKDIVSGLEDRGFPMPVLVRIENLLDQQITRLNEAFASAIEGQNYQGSYRGVFPIKVNQQSQVIEEIAEFGSRFSHGLEAGSKPELLIALATLESTDSHIICNGYKDEEFIRLGLGAQKLGYKIFFVVETPAEIPLLISCSEAMGVRPHIGVRVKLASRVGGHWNATSGDRSIFGLNPSQLIDLIDELKAHEMIDCLELLHVHLGSQIPNIRDIRTGVMEACRFYAELVGEGASMGYLDLGGGLAVDYDGTRSNQTHSKNYSLEEYCMDVVEVIMTTLDPLDIAHPTIVTESGRALVAYSSILLFNVLDVTRFEAHKLPERLGENRHEHVNNLAEVLAGLTEPSIQEAYNDAVYYRDELRELFRRGQLGLRDRSMGEDFFLEIMHRIEQLSGADLEENADLEGLRDYLADIYYGNFSLFQSLPDIWAIDQVFPIMPIHRLNEEPTRRAVIADITCDCDGKIDKFVCDGSIQNTLPLHSLKDGEEYYLGVFLVGAYQETLGDLHNLLGDTHVVSVRVDELGRFKLVKEVEGDSVADVLSYVEYQPQELLKKFRARAEQGVDSGVISGGERQQLMQLYSDGLRGYTYFER